MKILILRNSLKQLDENNYLFANEFLNRGWDVFFGLVNTVSTHNYNVFANVASCNTEVEMDENLVFPLEYKNIEDFHLVWVMNQPHPQLAKDIWQILWMLSKQVPFANSVESMNFLNNKNTLGYIVPKEYLLENNVSNSFETLWHIYKENQNKSWVLKPTNSGCGADVFLIKPGFPNTKPLIQSMTGNTTAVTEITDGSLIGLQNKYAILQEYASEVTKGEKRVIIAGGEIVTWHGRALATEDHRSNVTQGGEFFASDLTSEEEKMCKRLGKKLIENGVGYIGLDISYPYVLEFNMVNPGGVYDAMQVTGNNYSSKAVDYILNTRMQNVKA